MKVAEQNFFFPFFVEIRIEASKNFKKRNCVGDIKFTMLFCIEVTQYRDPKVPTRKLIITNNIGSQMQVGVL
jgi:hypothetical protein